MTSSPEQNLLPETLEPDMSEQFLSLLSVPRLQPYVQTFQPSSEQEKLGAYLWGQAISASLHPFLGIFEVVLRNAVHKSLSIQCSNGEYTSYEWYDKAAKNSILLKGKSQEKIRGFLYEGEPSIRKATQPSPDVVVSRLSFGFWPNVLEELNNRYAPQTFCDVFSNYKHSTKPHWSKENNRADVIVKLKKLQDLRNRICHFEPIWKHHWLGVSGTHWSRAVQRLRALHEELLEVLTWCSPSAAIFYTKSFGYDWFTEICTTAAVFSFMNNHAEAAHLVKFKKKEDLKKFGEE